MANTAGIAKSFKTELLKGIHAFGTSVVRAGTGADTFKGALYLTTATIDTDTTAYTATGEIGDSGSYVAGGLTITNATEPTGTGGTSYWTPSADYALTGFTSSGNFDCLLIYNSTQSNKAVMVLTFGTQFVTSGSFTLNMPNNSTTEGLLRLS